jgi:sec-independent protein translocase protein TatA
MIPGPTELILILLIVIMVFGAKKIPEIMGGLGKGIKSFKKAMEGEENPETTAPPLTATPTQPAAPPAPAQNAAAQDASVPKEKIEPK